MLCAVALSMHLNLVGCAYPPPPPVAIPPVVQHDEAKPAPAPEMKPVPQNDVALDGTQT